MRRCFLFVVGFVAVSVAAPFSHAVELTAREEAYLESRGREIRVALPGNYVPLSFVGEKGEFEGVMPDFLRWFGDRADVNFKFFVATPSQAKQGVAEGVYDVVGIYSPSLKQDAAIACSAVVLDVPLGIFVPDSSSIQMLSDLEGKILAYQGKSVGRLLDSLRLDFGKVEYHQLSDMLDSVEYGETDAAVYSELPILNYVHAGKTAEMYRQVGDYLYTNKICVGVSSANEMLLSLLNQGVAAAQDEGVIRWIERRWAGGSYTSFLLVMEKYSHYLIMGVGGLLLAVLLFWVWDVRLTRHIQKKTRELRSSEERLRAIFQSSPDAIFIESEEGVVLDANPVACAFHGLTHEELVGTHVVDLVPDDQRESVEINFPKWFTGELKRYEGFSNAAGGREVPVEVIGAPLLYEEQQAVVLQVRDMTERKLAEQALKQSEARYRGLIELQSSLITRMDTEGRFTFVNEAFCRFVGRTRGELIGEFFHPYVYYDDLDQPRRAIKDLVNGEERKVVIEHRMRAQAHIAWVQWEDTAIYDESGSVVEIQTVGYDTTERRRIHEALEESERRLRFLFEEIPHIAVQGYNEAHEVLFWNRASELLYGYSRDEAMGKKIEDLVVPPDQRAQIAEAIDHWRETGQPMPAGEMMKCRSDGQLVPVYASRLATKNARGEREMYVVDVDLSELKRASEELVKAKDFAERASRAKSEFLANMSHEIRTPMNGVMGMTHLLLDTGLDDEQRELAQTVMDSTKELLIIIDELLDISRIEAGEVRLQMEPFCPRETVEKVTLLFADRASKKGVDLLVAVHPDVPQKMMGDAGRIRQVLINLVGNALKFTHDGQIQIRLQAEKIDHGWNLLVDVKDTGIGMNQELQERVFDKFSQGDTSSTREHGGAGLGLAITKQLVELMGGKISVTSEEGQGTMFDFNIILPALEEDVIPVADKPIDKKSTELAAEILLVEDNLVNQKVATAMIKKLGCTVTVARNGAVALKVISDQRFDLIFMDCQMPIMDGFETTRAIRQMVGAIRDIPIVAMTAHALKEDRQKCLDAGMDDYLSKPVHRDELLAVLQKYCG